MKILPKDVVAYKRTPIFTNETIPQGLFKNHTTRENVWALLQVVEGKLEYIIQEEETHILEPGKNGIIEPKVTHRIWPLEEVKFFLEFYK